MTNFNKVTQPLVGKTYDGCSMPVFVKIEYKDGKLSISGVEGPTQGGNCMGAFDQIDMHLNNGQWRAAGYKPGPGWTPEMVDTLLDYWDKWHLNDLRAGCEHQKGAEWEPKTIRLYYYRLTRKAYQARKDAEKRATSALTSGETFTPTPEEVRICTLPLSVTSHLNTPPTYDYELNGPQYANDHYNKPFEDKQSNWVYPSEHPDGLLTKPCSVCGYHYGSAWRKEEVPQDILTWLASVSESQTKPAWV